MATHTSLNWQLSCTVLTQYHRVPNITITENCSYFVRLLLFLVAHAVLKSIITVTYFHELKLSCILIPQYYGMLPAYNEPQLLIFCPPLVSFFTNYVHTTSHTIKMNKQRHTSVNFQILYTALKQCSWVHYAKLTLYLPYLSISCHLSKIRPVHVVLKPIIGLTNFSEFTAIAYCIGTILMNATILKFLNFSYFLHVLLYFTKCFYIKPYISEINNHHILWWIATLM